MDVDSFSPLLLGCIVSSCEVWKAWPPRGGMEKLGLILSADGEKGTMGVCDSDRMAWEEMIVAASVSDRVVKSKGCFYVSVPLFFLFPPAPFFFPFFHGVQTM